MFYIQVLQIVHLENEVLPESLLAYLDPVSTGMFSRSELEEAFCRDVHHLSLNFEDRPEFNTLEVLVVGLGVMVVVLLLVLGCLILSGCVCWCCFESCRRKVYVTAFSHFPMSINHFSLGMYYLRILTLKTLMVSLQKTPKKRMGITLKM